LRRSLAKDRQVADERWVLHTSLNPDEINGRLETLVSGRGVRQFLAKRGAAPRVAHTKVAPDSIVIARSSSARFGVVWDVYPPRLAGTIRSGEFVLFPARGDVPKMSGTLFPDSSGTRIDLRMEAPSAGKAIVAIAAIAFAFVGIIFTGSLISSSTDGDTRWDLLVPAMLIPTVFAVAVAVWRQVRKSNRQLVELLCEALDASVLSGPPPL
jgi:hypothetical protein